MTHTRSVLVAALALTFVVGAASPVCAEWFGSLYLGYAITAETDLTFAPKTSSTAFTFKDVEFLKSVVYGARAGYWFRENQSLGDVPLGTFGRYLGVDLDFSYFHPRIPGQRAKSNFGPGFVGALDVGAVTLTPELLLRYPLFVDRDFPQGRLQPYVGLGPSLFIAWATDVGSYGPRDGSANDTSVGFNGRTGVQWHVTDVVQLFAEYRLVHGSPGFDFDRGPVDFTINSHQFNFGVSYLFGR